MSRPSVRRDRNRLIASAIRHAALYGRMPLCIAIPGTASDAEQSAITAASPPIVVVDVKSSRYPGAGGPSRSASDGRNVTNGRWSLPPGARHVYLIDSWGRVTLPMLREAVRQDVVTLTARYPAGWATLPLQRLRSVVVARNRLYAAIARMRTRFPPVPQPLGSTAIPQRAAPLALRQVQPAYTPVPGRIVLACGSLSPGGAERQVAYTAGMLHAAPGVERCEVLCDYLTPDQPAKYDFYLPYLLARKVAVRSPERSVSEIGDLLGTPFASFVDILPEAFLMDAANLYHEFIRIKPEVVYAWLDWSNTRAGLAAALAGVPRILLSGRNLNPSRFALYQPYMDIVYRRLCDLPNVRLLNNSRAGADDYAKWIGIPPHAVSVIYNAFDEPTSPPSEADAGALRQQLGIPPEASLVGGAFRLSDEKRPLLWIEAAARVARAHKDVWFLICGDGSMRAQVESRALKLGIRDRLVMTGVRADVFTAIRMMDVFLLTSFAEGLPNVLIEAQWLGTPVVATAVGGTPETVDPDRTARLVATDNPQDLADAVLSLLDDPAWRTRARSLGPELVRKRFGMQRMLTETLNACFPGSQSA